MIMSNVLYPVMMFIIQFFVFLKLRRPPTEYEKEAKMSVKKKSRNLLLNSYYIFVQCSLIWFFLASLTAFTPDRPGIYNGITSCDYKGIYELIRGIAIAIQCGLIDNWAVIYLFPKEPRSDIYIFLTFSGVLKLLWEYYQLLVFYRISYLWYSKYFTFLTSIRVTFRSMEKKNALGVLYLFQVLKYSSSILPLALSIYQVHFLHYFSNR